MRRMRPGGIASFSSSGRLLKFFSSAALRLKEVGSHVIIVREQIQNPPSSRFGSSQWLVFTALG